MTYVAEMAYVAKMAYVIVTSTLTEVELYSSIIWTQLLAPFSLNEA